MNIYVMTGRDPKGKQGEEWKGKLKLGKWLSELCGISLPTLSMHEQ